MRTRASLVVVVLGSVLAAVLLGCDGKLRVTGRLAPGTSQAPLEGTPQVGVNRQGLRTSEGPVARVLAFRGFGRADAVDVEADGRFAIDVSRDQPVGLVFLDATDAVVGVLSLGDGVSALPTSVAAGGLAEVDLSTITLDAGVATAAADPLAPGGALALDATQREVFALQSSLFSSIVRNLDLNHDDVIDVRSARPYWLMFQAIYVTPAVSGEPAQGSAPSFNEFRLLFSDGQPVELSPQPVLRLPDGVEFRGAQPELRWTGDQDGSQLPGYVWGSGSNAASFAAGPWAITYGAASTRLDFDVVTPLSAQRHLVAVDVWQEKSGDTLTLHWRWGVTGGGVPGVDGPRLIKFVIPGLYFSDGSMEGVQGTPPPSQTSFSFPLRGRTPSRYSITARDFFGNETWTQGPVQ